jgi:hypothetical protein
MALSGLQANHGEDTYGFMRRNGIRFELLKITELLLCTPAARVSKRILFINDHLM